MAQLGDRVGHIRIVDSLAKGGMGEVFVGFDEKLQRKVALKVIRGEHHLDGEAKSRFLREARVLSQLEHPYICRIYDLLESGDEDYIVLELIQGKNLRDAIREGLSERDKWRVAEQILLVLAATHEKGIVHRDLKPENVMIAADGNVKVLDFGLARTLVDENAPTAGVSETSPAGSPASQAPSATGTQLGTIMGTLGYMSPEQASGEPATAASDMYSFGLIFQQLFTGKLPFDPSLPRQVLLDKSKKGETLPTEGLDTDITALIDRLKSFAPAARPSAVDTAERLAWLRLKPKRRKKRTLAISAISILVLTTLVMAFLAFRLSREVDRANREATTARQVSDFLVNLFEVSDPSEARGNSITARELLDQGSDKIEVELKDQPLTQARLMETMGTVYRSLGLYDKARPLLESALQIRRKALGEEHPEVAQSLFGLAVVTWYQGDADKAKGMLEEALGILKANGGEESALGADILSLLGGVYWGKGDQQQALKLSEQALAIREKVLGSDDPKVAKSLLNLAMLLDLDGQAAKAEPLFKRALQLQEKRLGADHPDLVPTLNNFAAFYDERGEFAKAEPLYVRALAISEKTLGGKHPNTATAVNNLADVYQKQGKNAEAERLYQRSLQIWRESLGVRHPDVAYALTGLANVYRDQGDFVKAEPLYQEALSIREKAPDTDPQTVAETLTHYANLLRKMGKVQEAQKMEARAKAMAEN